MQLFFCQLRNNMQFFARVTLSFDPNAPLHWACDVSPSQKRRLSVFRTFNSRDC